MARVKAQNDRKKDQELGLRMLHPENLDILFEYWDLHGLGLRAWKKQRARKRER